MSSFRSTTKLKALRLREKLSQRKMAEITGLALSSVNELESGKVQMSMVTLFKLCKFFKVTPNEIIEYEKYFKPVPVVEPESKKIKKTTIITEENGI